ncbi:MAG: P-loop NTPase, partial [Nitrospira sp.]
YARDMGIKVLGMVENMSEYRCPACGVESALFEGDTQALCDALNVPLLGRIPFDRTFAKTFDKGEPLLDPTYPTIKKYLDVAGRIIQIVDLKKVLAQKL